ncbi:MULTISPECIES: TetR/AcrR family transcriptional regulator [Nocardia]|uniref:TetR/AcrR family transcriptional regulator n=1 Tax=Nocardia TaxID=1817 RepID=UPI001893041D|nr:MULTISPECIES: TetR/AcrR family transcriptional regulator [Nocardia]MBF6348392.1 TetR/AcrR family transcriptional regulator C-terminal domain-containing protein [Nocardia flavorosea]
MAKKFDSVWTRAARQPRTSGLTRDHIVQAAIALLDEEGLEALSMRKLGAHLGAGATSLYWYVANKNELLELALDEFWGLVDDGGGLEEAGTLREVLTTYAYNMRSVLLAHPWAATLIGQLPSWGPRAFQLGERLRRTFTAAGFRKLDVYLAGGTVNSYVLGQVVPIIAMEKAQGGPVRRADLAETLDELATDYPAMRADYRTVMPEDSTVGQALGFDFGLVCVLDGLETRLRTQRNTDTVSGETRTAGPA